MKTLLIDVCVTGMIWLSIGGRTDAYLLYRDWWEVTHGQK